MTTKTPTEKAREYADGQFDSGPKTTDDQFEWSSHFNGYLTGYNDAARSVMKAIEEGCESAKAGQADVVVAFLEAVRDEMLAVLPPSPEQAE